MRIQIPKIKNQKSKNQKITERVKKRPLATYWISPTGELRRNHLAISFFCLSLSSVSSMSAISLSLSLSLCFGSVGDFEKELNLRFVFCLCVFVVEGRKRIRIWSGPLVWFGGVCVMREMDGRDCLGPTEVSNQTHVVWDL